MAHPELIQQSRIFLRRNRDRGFLVLSQCDRHQDPIVYRFCLPGGERRGLDTTPWEQINKTVIRNTAGVQIDAQELLTTQSVGNTLYHFYVATFVGTPQIETSGATRSVRWMDISRLTMLLSYKTVVLEAGMSEAMPFFARHRRRRT